MKCPNCGNIIPDGKLYCESCGAELQIVPDFEDEEAIDKEMKKTMKNIANNEFAKEYDMDFDDDPNLISMVLAHHKSGKAFYIVLGLVLVVIIAALIYLGSTISHRNSYDYQLEQAEEKANDNNLLGAISNLEAAYKIEPSSELLFTIADYYYTLDRENDAIYTLLEIANGEFPSADIETAYRKVITLYANSQSYQAIADILSTCSDSTILSEYADFCVYTPEFNVEDGTYDETITVKISAGDGTGHIYYTTDNSVPSQNSEVFDTPIFLEYGSYNINAVYINAYGVSSEVVSAKYLIDVDFVFEPEILTESGEYTEATLIEADVPILYTLYYTTDGTDPDKTSKRYTSPIPMPEGDTTFKFIMYASDGTTSSIVEKNYTLHLEASLTPAEGVSKLVSYLVEKGMLNEDGKHKDGYNGDFLYMYSAIYPIEDMGNFYFVVEYYQDEAGNITNTTNIYAVGCNDGLVYRAISNGEGSYTLQSF